MSESKQGESRITVTCPSCHQTFRANVSLAGQTVKCPQCSEQIHIPAMEPPPFDGICPACNKMYRVHGVESGQVIRCPLCDAAIYAVPSFGAARRPHAGDVFSTGLHVMAFVVLLLLGTCQMSDPSSPLSGLSSSVQSSTVLVMLTMIVCTSFIASAIKRHARRDKKRG